MRRANQDDFDDLREALYDALSDGEGRVHPGQVLHHLRKHGFEVVVPDEPEPDVQVDPPWEEGPDDEEE